MIICYSLLRYCDVEFKINFISLDVLNFINERLFNSVDFFFKVVILMYICICNGLFVYNKIICNLY